MIEPALITRGAFPVLVSHTVLIELVEPTRTVPKLSEVVLSDATGAVPVPVSEMF